MNSVIAVKRYGHCQANSSMKMVLQLQM